MKRFFNDSTTSPLIRWTCELAVTHTHTTALSLTGGSESLTLLAARLVVGVVTEVGTGRCQLLYVS
jgi:hypothetical protein